MQDALCHGWTPAAHSVCFALIGGLRRSLVHFKMQADVELLQSQEYLQAVVQFATHLQALLKNEHVLRGKSMVPTALHDFQCTSKADVSPTYQYTAAVHLAEHRLALCPLHAWERYPTARRSRIRRWFCRCCSLRRAGCSSQPEWLCSSASRAVSILQCHRQVVLDCWSGFCHLCRMPFSREEA